MIPLIVFIVWVGVYPAAFTGPTEASLDALIGQVQSKASVAGRAPDGERLADLGRP